MKITFDPVMRGSDLILHEMEPFPAYCRAITVVTLTGAEKLQLGSPVFRARGVTGAKWTLVKAAADIAVTNEIAFYYADQLGEIFETTGAGDHNVLSLVRGNIILKDKAIKDALTANGFTPSATEFASLKELASLQSIVIEKVIQ